MKNQNTEKLLQTTTNGVPVKKPNLWTIFTTYATPQQKRVIILINLIYTNYVLFYCDWSFNSLQRANNPLF